MPTERRYLGIFRYRIVSPARVEVFNGMLSVDDAPVEQPNAAEHVDGPS